MPRIQTEAVRDKLIGDARKAFKKVAGDDGKVSKADAEALAPDHKRAVDFARKEHRIVTVERAVESYAHHVTEVLDAVDRKGKGQLSLKETAKITDAELRARIDDIRGKRTAPTGGAGSVNAAQLTAKIEDMQEEWGSENIMDGVVALSATVPHNGGVLETAKRDFAALGPAGSGGDGTVDEFIGAVKTDGPRKLQSSDTRKLAEALNDDGFQYAQRDEVARIKKQIEDVLKKLGGPTGLDVAIVKQEVKPSHIDFGNDPHGVPGQLWTFSNAKTGDAVSFTVIKGTL
jgi:hypothetical protein